MMAMSASTFDRPLLRFVQINDCHVYAGPFVSELHYCPTNNDKLRWLIKAINSERYFPLPDLALGLGDLIAGGEPERLGPDLQAAFDIIRPLRCPLMPLMGNHEIIEGEGVAELEAPYRHAFGDDRVHYTFQRGGVQFIMFNNPGAPSAGAKAVKARNAWLKAALEEYADWPKILCCHVPLISLRDSAALRASFGFESYFAQDEQCLALVDAHAESIIAVLCGHLHLTAAVWREGVAHICPSGTASYPCDYGLYTLYGDRLEYEVRSLPPRFALPETTIHARPRHAVDYTDTAHGTVELYVRGLPEERRLNIPLTGRKTPRTPGAM